MSGGWFDNEKYDRLGKKAVCGTDGTWVPGKVPLPNADLYICGESEIDEDFLKNLGQPFIVSVGHNIDIRIDAIAKKLELPGYYLLNLCYEGSGHRSRFDTCLELVYYYLNAGTSVILHCAAGIHRQVYDCLVYFCIL
jgi:hypothetical protein